MGHVDLLIGTVFLRPYVFAFLLAYFVSCSALLGLKRAALFCVAGYLIAWLSEYSSINNGFPYGFYNYFDHTRDSELWVLGVPFMDSLSYVFLAYASYSMALLSLSPPRKSRWLIYLLETKRIRHSIFTAVLGALFFVYLDIIIDPVALKGERWFLGQLYSYPAGGVYFGVPLSNFGGWLLVGFLMIIALQAIDKYLDRKKTREYFANRYGWRHVSGPGIYIGVIVFNIAVTFSISEHMMGWTAVFIIFLPLALIISNTGAKLYYENPEAIKAHLKDFPGAVRPD